jgi:hypothetical protein
MVNTHRTGNRKLGTVAHWANAIATAFLVVLGIWAARATQNALELSQRAWLSPVGAQITPLEIKPAESTQGAPTPIFLKKDQPIHFALAVTNSGKQPALDIKVRILNYTIDGFDLEKTTMEALEVPDNTSCNGLLPEKGRLSIAPSAVAYHNLSSAFGEPSFTADDKIVSGEKFYVVRGCIAYETFGAVHRSGFCYFLENRQRGNVPPPFGDCPRGFQID